MLARQEQRLWQTLLEIQPSSENKRASDPVSKRRVGKRLGRYPAADKLFEVKLRPNDQRQACEGSPTVTGRVFANCPEANLVCFVSLPLLRVLEQWTSGKGLGSSAWQLVGEIVTIKSRDVILPVKTARV